MTAVEPVLADEPIPTDEFAGWRRVDPRTLALVVVPVLAFSAIYGALALSGPSGDRMSAAVEAVVPLLAMTGAVVRYLTGRYAVIDGAVRWRSGLLVHRSTQIALERIQDVEVTRPLVARVLGLTAVTVSSAGGEGEIKLTYLDGQTAARLGRLLQQHGRAASVPTVGASDPDAASPVGASGVAVPVAVEVHQVDSGELAAWVAVRVWPVPALLVVVAVVLLIAGVPPLWLALLPVLPVALVGAVGSVVDRFGLQVRVDDTSLATNGGLVTVRRTSTPRRRVQMIVATRLWVQGMFGREGVRFASADVTGGGGHESVRGDLALNVAEGSWERLAATVAGRPVLGSGALASKSPAVVAVTRQRWAIAAVLVGAVVGSVMFAIIRVLDRWSDSLPTGAAAFVMSAGTAVVVAAAMSIFGQARGELRVRVERWGVDHDDLVVVTGLMRRRTLLLFASKTQAISIRSGPLQRRAGLVTVEVDAAPPGRSGRVVVADLTCAAADDLVAALTAAGQVALPDGV